MVTGMDTLGKFCCRVDTGSYVRCEAELGLYREVGEAYLCSAMIGHRQIPRQGREK